MFVYCLDRTNSVLKKKVKNDYNRSVCSLRRFESMMLEYNKNTMESFTHMVALFSTGNAKLYLAYSIVKLNISTNRIVF